MPSTSAQAQPTPYGILARVLTGLVGVYAFVWSLTAFGIAALHALGMGFHQAEAAMYLVAFLLYLTLLLWSFAAKRLMPVVLILLSGALIMAGAALAVQHSLVA